MTCPLPAIGITPAGLTVQPHCMNCIQQSQIVAHSLLGSKPPLPTAQKTSKRRPLASQDDFLEYLKNRCSGTGKTYEAIIADISSGSITPQKDPAEFQARLNALYVRMPKLKRQFEVKYPGSILDLGATWKKTRVDNLPTMLRRVTVKPV